MEFRGKYNFLSNFYPVNITIDDITYPSVELDMFFQKIVILCCVGFVSCFAILFATVYISNAMAIAMILETAKFEVTADGSIIKIDNNTITYLDNKTNE